MNPIFLILCLYCLLVGRSWGAHSNTIYLYDPSININSYVSLKREFDQLLKPYGDVYFQPITDRILFESTIKKDVDALFLLPGAHCLQLQKKHWLTPILIGKKNKQIRRRNYLVIKKGKKLQDLDHGKLAATGSLAHVQSLLKPSIFKQQHVSILDYKVLIVPKEIDALMSVGFGMATAALVSHESLEQYRHLNNYAANNLDIVLETERQLRLVAAINSNQPQHSRPLISILKKLSQSRQGKRQLRRIGLDAWQDISDKPLQQLTVDGGGL